MKFTTTRDHMGRTGIVATPGDYDGYPLINTLWLDVPREEIVESPDRFAVACVLAFGSYCSGELDFGRKIGPATVGAIRRYLSPVEVAVRDVEYYPKALPLAEGMIRIGYRIGAVEPIAKFGIQLLDSHNYSGSVRGTRSWLVPTNAGALQVLSERRGGRGDALVAAVFCLVAEQFGVDRAEVDCARSAEDPAVRDLLDAVRLGIGVGQEGPGGEDA